MVPDTPQAQPGNPATLPPVQIQPPAATPPAPDNGNVPAQASAIQGPELAVAQARHLVEQFHTNPYRLNGALQQLKSEYLAERFHINTNPSQK